MLVLFYGSDIYRLQRAAGAFIDAQRSHYRSALNVCSVDCLADDAEEQLERPLKYPSFFDAHTIVLATNGAVPATVELLKRYRVEKLADVTLLVAQDTGSSYDKKALAAVSKAAGRIESFEPLKGAPLAAWVRAFCEERGHAIEPAALTMVLARAGSDTYALAMELEKLCAYAGSRSISVSAVQTLTPLHQEQDAWELSNALASMNKRAAIVALWRRLYEGTSEQLLVGSLASGLRTISMIKDLQERHQPPAAIAKLTGIHPFVVSKNLKGAAQADAKRLRQAHLQLARLDRASKNGLSDTVDGLFSILLGL